MASPVPASPVVSTSGSTEKTAPSAINPATKKTVITPAQAAKAKSINVFSNDGSFLERFKKLKEDEVEKKKQGEALVRKRAFDDRIKNRGKRTVNEDGDDGIVEVKKAKTEEVQDAYLAEVRRLQASHAVRDDGSGVRSLVK